MAKKVFCIGNGESRKGFDLEKLRPHGTIYGCNAIYRDFMPDVLTAVDHGIMHEIYHAGIAQKIPCYFRDWTKVPAMTYEPMLMGGISNLEEAKEALDKVLISNDRGDSQEYVMHGSKLSGVIDLIKKEPDKFNKDKIKLQKKEVNHATIKVSWIKEPDYSHNINDISKPRDHGWACGASAGYVAVKIEQPDEIYLIGHDLHSQNNNVNNIYKSTKNYVAKENGPTPAVNWIRQWYTLADWYPNIKFIKINRFNDGRDKVNGPIDEWNERTNITYADYSTLDNLV